MIEVTVNGEVVSLPDIPSDVLESYPYAAIVYTDGGTNTGLYQFVASKEPQYYASSAIASAFGYGSNPLIGNLTTGYITGQSTAATGFDPVEWAEVDESTTACMFALSCTVSGLTLTLEVVGANHDIYEITGYDTDAGNFTLGNIYFAANFSVSVSYYAAPKSWYDGMAQQVMRLSETTSKLTTDAMLSALKGVEVGGTSLAENERIYQVGGGSMVYDMSGLSFTNSAVGEVTS